MEVKKSLSKSLKKLIIDYQRIEITEHYVYRFLAKKVKGKNQEILKRISDDEGRHAQFWQQYTGVQLKPSRLKLWKYLIIQKILGLTFTIKMMEKGEETAERNYKNILEGLSFALQNTRLVGMAGLITGIAASLSMASSEYLSKRTEASDQNPLVAAFYTGIAYIFTVLLLVGPFFVFSHYLVALLNTLIFVIFVIWFFSFFVSIVKEMNFKRTFIEMAVISLGVTIISFGIGMLTRYFLGVDV